MKVYRIEYDRRINETLTIPVDLVKEIQTYDGIVQLVVDVALRLRQLLVAGQWNVVRVEEARPA